MAIVYNNNNNNNWRLAPIVLHVHAENCCWKHTRKRRSMNIIVIVLAIHFTMNSLLDSHVKLAPQHALATIVCSPCMVNQSVVGAHACQWEVCLKKKNIGQRESQLSEINSKWILTHSLETILSSFVMCLSEENSCGNSWRNTTSCCLN